MRPIYTAIGIFLLLLFFPKTSFYLGTIAVIIGDGFAGLVGRRFGRNKIFYSKEKTIEGSLACLVTTFLFSIFFTNPLFALIIAIITTFIESIPMKEENLILSLSVGIASLFLI
jgi:dolichol kinase